MKKIVWIVILLILPLAAGSVFSCVSSGQSTNPSQSSTLTQPLQDVSSLMPEMFENVMQGGYGNPDADIQLDAVFADFPEQIVVYQVKQVNDARAQYIASLFGLENDPVPLIGGERQVYSYADDEQVLEIDLDGRFRLYQRQSPANLPVSLPAEEECINIAEEYLRLKGLFPDNVVRVTVGVSQTIVTVEAGTDPGEEIPVRLSVSFYATRNVYETDVTRVTIGDKGRVLELSCNNLELDKYGSVRLKTPEAAYDMLTAYLKDGTFPPPPNHEIIVNWRGEKLTIIRSLTIEYATPANTFYYQPVYVFEGDVYLAGQENPEHFAGRVDAIQR
jgi:hypothetical protein